jgi:hypothetical protein
MIGNIEFIDVSGYLMSGKSAVSNLLQEVRGVGSPDKEEDFELIRIQGGIADLEEALVRRWSIVRSDAAIRRFMRVIKFLGASPVGFERIWRSGAGYNNLYPNFSSESTLLIEKLVKSSFTIEWPFPIMDGSVSSVDLFFEKIQRKLLKSHVLWPHVDFYWSDGESFYEAIRSFLDNIFYSRYGSDVKKIVINNALEPYCPQDYFNYFHKIKSIVVERDPRDIYIAAINYSKSASKDRDVFAGITSANNLNHFIERMKIQRKKISQEPHPDVLRISFEDLVLNYEATKCLIFNFIGLYDSDHVKRYQFFNPIKSSKSCNMWLRYEDQEAMKKIAEELSL